MKIKIVGAVLALSALMTACDPPKGGDQAEPICLVAHGTFATNFFLKTGAGCPATRNEVVGFQKYSPDRSKPGFVAATPWDVHNAATTPTPPYAQGDFTAKDPQNDLCTVPSMTPVTTAGAPTYTFSNVTFYVTPRSPGTQVKGTVRIQDGACDGTYDFYGMYPAVDCTGEAFPETDPRLCDPVAAPLEGYPTGSGINPDFKTSCIPEPTREVAHCYPTTEANNGQLASDFLRAQ